MSSERFFRVKTLSRPRMGYAVFGRISVKVYDAAVWRLRAPVDMQVGEIWRIAMDAVRLDRPRME